MEFSESDTEQLFELLRWRRDVRHFKSVPVPDTAFAKMRHAMHLAPSVGNSRPWRVVRVDTPALRKKIIASHSQANEEAAKDYSGDRQDQYLKLKLAGLREAPLQLAIFTDPDPEQGHGLGRKTMPETLLYSTVSAIHQLWLVARTMNIGVGWVSILDKTDINQTLSVNPDWIFTAYLCIGYPKEASDEPELQQTGWQKNEEADWLIR